MVCSSVVIVVSFVGVLLFDEFLCVYVVGISVFFVLFGIFGVVVSGGIRVFDFLILVKNELDENGVE